MSAESKKLQPPNSYHLRAAEGWLGLGNYFEASEELELIAAEFKSHPAVLMMRCNIYQAGKKWDHVIMVSQCLVEQLPRLPDPWIQRSYALHELKRTAEAFDLLLPAAKRFPKLPVIPYNLACYACQLKHLKDAKQWLKRAFDLADKNHDIRLDALKDPDLEPMWNHIGEI